MPFPLDKFRGEAPRVLKMLAQKAVVIEMVTGITEYMRHCLAGMTRADVQKGQAQSIVMMLLSSIPANHREKVFLAIEELLEDGPLRHSPLSDILVALVESADDGVRDFMARENISQQEALEFVRDEVIPGLSNNITNLRTKLAARIAATKGDLMSTHEKTNTHTTTEAAAKVAAKAAHADEAFDPTKVVGLSTREMDYLMAVCWPAILEGMGDAGNRDFLGLSRQFMAGCRITLEAQGPNGLKQYLPLEQSLTDVERDPFTYGVTFIRAMIFVYTMKNPDRIPPHFADLIDKLGEKEKFLAWIRRRKGQVAEGATAGEEREAEAPKWVTATLPYLKEALGLFTQGNLTLVEATAWCLGLGVVAFVVGAALLVMFSIVKLSWVTTWLVAFLIFSLGMPLIFSARAILGVFDTQLTLAMMPFQVIPPAVRKTLEAAGVELPKSERDGDSPRATFNWFRDHATLVVVIGAVLNMVVTVIAAHGMVLSTAHTTSTGALLFLGNFALMSALGMGETLVRERLRMLEPAKTKWEKALKTLRVQRARTAAYLFGVMLATSIGLFLVTAVTSSFLKVRETTESEEKAEQTEDCREVITRRVAASKAYAANPAANGRGVGAYCVDFPAECSRCR